ncbi:MAG: hypothetical protein KDA45_09235, partial [Planctomycetales bacterium]|nr:hypothetical protein [Planctomycetales bacterium]
DPKIGDCLPLESSPATDGQREQLLTVCSAASNAEEVAFRQQKFPQAVAEDMEGFGVALACRLAGLPLRIVRGISNRAGDRQTQNWCIRPAMESAVDLTRRLLEL